MKLKKIIIGFLLALSLSFLPYDNVYSAGNESLFTNQSPATLNATDGPTTNYELGMRFKSAVDGQITAIRFYKDSKETGTHTGRIWGPTGTLLASVVFSGETSSGWQQQSLSSPLSITANTQYTVTVNTSNTYFVTTTNGLASKITNGNLSSVVGTNGVFGNVGAYPTQAWNSSNYFRDVVFVANDTSGGGTTPPPSDTTAPVISNILSSSISTSGSTITWSTDEISDTQVEYGLTTSYGASTVLDTNLSASHSASLSLLSANTLYHFRVKSKDASGNLAVSSDQTFTTQSVVVTPPSDTTAPTTPSSLTATAVSTSGINLSWTSSTDATGVTGYKVYRGGVQIGTTATNSYSDTGLSASTLYSYTVSAYDAAGNNSVQSSSASATTQAVAQSGSANYYIAPNGNDGNSCISPSSPCLSINGALSKASAGQTIEMAAGTYGSQSISASKTSPGVTVKCVSVNSGATSNACKTGAIDAGGSWYTLQDITIDVGDTVHGSGWGASGSNITFKNVKLHGDFAAGYMQPGTTNFTWDGGEWGDQNNLGGRRSCANQDGYYLYMLGDSAITNITLRNLDVWPQQIDATPCNGDPLHMETIRIDGKINGMLIDRLRFHDGAQDNTGTIFFSTFRGVPNNVTIQNSYLGSDQNSSIIFGGGTNINIRYNTIASGIAQANLVTGLTLTGNAGWWQSFAGCIGTQVKNVWQWDQTFSCGSNKVVIGPQYSMSNLGLTSEYVAQSSSPLVNAGETSCSVTNDILGNGRPAGSACDAGAYEYQSGGVTPPPSDTTAPTTPSSLTATAVSTSAINLSWTASTDATGVTGYKVYRGGVQIGTTATNSYSDTGLSASTLYSYTVSAYDAAGNNSVQSSSASATTQSNVTSSTKFTTGQRVQTTANVNVRGIASATGSLLGTQSNGSLGTIVSGGTSVDGYYWWNVNYDSGVDGYSVEDYLTSYTAPAGDTVAPTVPTGLFATVQSSSAINLSWTASTDATGVTGYKVYRGGVQIGTTATNSYSDTGLSASTLYSYTVSAYDAAGNNSVQSSSASATTQAVVVGGTVRYVSTTGSNTTNCLSSASPCLTVAYAYTQANPGDTIQVASGSYGNQTIAYRAGMSGSPVVVKPAPGATITFTDINMLAGDITFQGPNFNARSFDVGCYNCTRINNVTIDGLNIDAQNTTNLTAMLIASVTNLTIKNSRIGNTMAGSVSTDTAKSMEFCGANSTCYAANVLLQNNTFYDADAPTGSAAHLECIFATGIQGFTVRGNRFQDCTYFDIFITVILANNQAQPKDYIFEDNLFGQTLGVDGSDFGYAINLHSDVQPNNFIFRRNTIEGAIATANGGGAIQAGGWQISSNIIAGGVYLSESTSQGCRSGITFSYNVMPNNCGTNTTTVSSATIRNDWVGPKLAYAGDDDFHLKSTSNALNKGNPAYAGISDFDGVVRGSTIDAGALEYNNTVVTDTTAPTTPSSLTATAVSTSAINLSWTASTDATGVTGYKVYRGGVQIGTTATNSYSDTGLSASTLYSYTVSAYDAAGNNSVQSSSASATTQAVVTGSCSATNVRCVGSGQEYTTIQAASNASVAGDTIVVYPGTYNERVSITRSGTSGSKITYQGFVTGGTCPSVVSADSNSRGFRPAPTVKMQGFDVNANYITIQCFEITGTGNAGAEISPSRNNIDFFDNYVHDGPWVLVNTTTNGGVASTRASYVTVLRNYVYKSQYGIILQCNNCTVQDNEFERMAGGSAGTDLDYSRLFGDNIVFRHNYMHGNSMADCTDGDCHIDCFQTWNIGQTDTQATNVTIDGNICLNSHEGIIARDTTHATPFSHNNWTVTNNVFSDGPIGSTHPWCMVFEHIGNVKVYNNVCNAGSAGFYDGTNVTFKNNIYINGGYNPYNTSASGWGDGVLDGSGNNLLYESGRTYSGFAGDILNKDPKFVNMSAYNFRLQSSSPAINVGANVGVSTDQDGNTRPQGSGYDIGAYEYTGTVSTPTSSTKFTTGQRVQTTANVNVRGIASATGSLLGTQSNGSLGTIVSGGTSVDGYYWWNVNYDSGVDGYSVEDYLTSYTTPVGDTVAPTVPTGLFATVQSSSAINLSWTSSTDATGVTGYKVYRGGVQIGTTATNSYSDTGLSASTLYSYTVSAYDAAGNNSSQSSSASATTQAVVTGSCSATNVRCVGSGQEYTTIQAASNASVAGDTIVVYPGTYNESVTITRSGSAGSKIVYQGYLPGSSCPTTAVSDINHPTGFRPNPSVTMNGFTVSANYIKIDCFNTNGNGVLDISSNGIHDVDSVNNYSKAGAGGSVGVYINDQAPIASAAQNIYVGYNYVEGGGYGVLQKCVNCKFEYNEFFRMNPGSSGADGDYSRIFGHDITFYKNYMHGNDRNLCGGTDCHIDCFQSFAYNSEFPAYNITIDSNVCMNASEGVIATNDSKLSIFHDWTIKNNVFAHSPLNYYGAQCMIISDITNVSVTNNTCTDMGVTTFANTTTGIHKNNIHDRVGTYLAYRMIGGANVTADHNLLYDTSYSYTSSGDVVNKNPLFVNSSIDNFRLQSSSPAINAGVNVGVLTDIIGSVRPQGSGYDIGAYEYTGTVSTPSDTTAPTVPSSLTATVVSTSAINLSWTSSTDATGVTGYKVYRGGVQIGTTATNSYSDTGLSASTLYSYTVSAYDAAGNNSAQSSSASATTQAVVVVDTTAPTISSITSSGITTSSATISWTTNESSDTQVEYGPTTSYGSFSTLNTTLSASHTVALSGLNSGTLYHFRVKSKDASGNLAVSSDQTFTTTIPPDTTAPNAISNLSAGSITNSSALLSFSAPGNDGTIGTASAYDIRYSTSNITSANFAGATQLTGEPTPLSSGTTQTYSIVGLSSGTRYYVAMQSKDASGNTSSISNVVSFVTTVPADTVAPTIPTGLFATVQSSSAINLSWTASTDATGVTGYKVYRGGVQIGTTATNSYSDTGLLSGTTYNYKVSAYDAAGNNSAQSSQATATTQNAPDTTVPVVTVVSPTNGATVSGTLNLSATVTDPIVSGETNSGVSNVVWKMDGSVIYTDTTSPYTHSFDTTTLSNGSHTLTARATDVSGNLSIIVTRTINVSNIVSVPVTPTLIASLVAVPNSGIAPLNGVTLTATITGTATGNINYYFYCDRDDTSTSTALTPNIKYLSDGSAVKTSSLCSYSAAGTYTPKVIVERNGLTSESRTNVTVSAPVTTPSSGNNGGGNGGGNSGGGGGGGGGGGVVTPKPKLKDLKASSLDSQVSLSWTEPTDTQFVRTVVVRKQGSSPTTPTDGVTIYEGTASSFVDTKLNNGTTYYYGVFPVLLTGIDYVPSEVVSASPVAGRTQISTTNAANVQNGNTGSSQGSTQSSGVNTGVFVRTLSQGMKGSDVIELQKFLISKGYLPSDLVPTDFYGPMTASAVQKFQCDNNIVCSGSAATTGYGVFGQKTRVAVSGGVSTTNTSTTSTSNTKTMTTQQMLDLISALLKQVAQLQEQLKALKGN